jgi:hypothetical protein
MINIKALLTLGTKGTDKAKKEVSDVNKQLDQAADNAERMNRTLAKTKTPGETKQYRTQRSIAGTRGAEGRNFAGLAQGGRGGSGSLVGAYAETAANVFALTAAFQALSNAAKVEQLTKGLELMGARGGVALTGTAKSLREVTDNAISAADSMRAVAQASSAGIDSASIERLGKVARGASLALGRDMSDSLDRLTRGTVKLEPELLDEIGIMVRLDDAVKDYAAQNNVAASSLTNTERRQAFLNAVLSEGEKKFGDINDQIKTNPYDQLSASIRDFATEGAKLINSVLTPIVKIFADNPFLLAVPGIFLLSKAFSGLGIEIQSIADASDKVFDKGIFKKGEAGPPKNNVETVMQSVGSMPDLKSWSDFNTNFDLQIENSEKKLTRLEKASIRARQGLIALGIGARIAASAMLTLARTIGAVLLPLLVITAVLWAITEAFKVVSKWIDSMRGLTQEVKDSKAAIAELATQAVETAKQIRLMMDPGKDQAGQAFDAMANSAVAARAAIEDLEKARLRAGKPNKGEEAPKVQFEYKAVSIDKAYEVLEKDLKSTGVSDEEAKLKIGQLKIAGALLSIEEEAAMLGKVRVRDIDKYLIGLTGVKSRFVDLQESAKNMNTLSKDLFPKETKNSIVELSREFDNFYKATLDSQKLSGDNSKTYNTGLAETFMLQRQATQDTITALKSQGIEIQGTTELLEKGKAVDEARLALQRAEELGEEEGIINAKEKYATAKLILGNYQAANPELAKQLAIQTLILGNKQKLLTDSLALNKLESDLASILGANAKSRAEIDRRKTIADFASTGADIQVPEEFSLEYKRSIAKLELDTAKEIARLKKESITLQMNLDVMTLAAQRKDLELTTEVSGTPEERLKKQAARNIVFDSTGNVRSQEQILAVLRTVQDVELATLIIQNNQLATTDERVRLTQQLAAGNMAAADITSKIADATLYEIEQQITARNKETSIAIRSAKYELSKLDTLKKSTDKARELQAALNGGADIGEKFSAILAKEQIPALQQQTIILTNQIAQQNEYRDEVEASVKLSEEERNLRLEQVDINLYNLGLEQQSLTLQQKKIAEIAQSYIDGDLYAKDQIKQTQQILGLTKELLSTRQKAATSALDLEGSQTAARAYKENRDVTTFEQNELTQKAAQLAIRTAIEERALLEKEHALKMQILALENKFVVAQMQSIAKDTTDPKLKTDLEALIKERENLNTKLEGLQTQINASEVSAANNAIGIAINEGLATGLQNLSTDFTIPEDMLTAITNATDSTQLQTALDNLKNAIQTATGRPQTLGEQIDKNFEGTMAGINRGMSNSIATFGMTQSAGSNYISQMDSARAEKEKDPDFDITAIEKQARKGANAISMAETAAAGLDNVLNTIQSSATDAFMGLIDGSKNAKEAFGEMALSILKAIAQMIVEMLVLKLIQSTMGMFGIPVPMASGGVIPKAAAGGIIPLATGGVMDRAMGVQGVIKQPTYLVGEGRYNEAVVPLPNGRSIPVQMHGGGSQNNNVAVNVNVSNSGQVQTETQGQDMGNLGQAIAVAVQKELMAQKMPGGILNRYGAS